MVKDERTIEKEMILQERSDSTDSANIFACDDVSKRQDSSYLKIVGDNPTITSLDIVDSWPIEQKIGYYKGTAMYLIMHLDVDNNPVESSKRAAMCCHLLTKLYTGKQ